MKAELIQTIKWMRKYFDARPQIEGRKPLGLYQHSGGGLTMYTPYYNEQIPAYTRPDGIVQILIRGIDNEPAWINCYRRNLISRWIELS